jgi:hypothetical protein
MSRKIRQLIAARFLLDIGGEYSVIGWSFEWREWRVCRISAFTAKE